jgi:peroxiredoxin
LRRLSAFLLIAALAAAAPAWADAPRIGATAPQVAGKTITGIPYDLGRLRGRWVVVANVWATWCAPCRLEMPALDAFYRRRPQGVAVIGFSADRLDALPKVQEVMAPFAYPAALLATARTNTLRDPGALPLTLVIDKHGVVRAVFGAGGAPLTEARLEAAVRPLLRGR